MAGEVTIPALPCRDIDETVDFYEALGFVRTYRQNKPNPYAVVSREDFHIHLFGIDGFDPEQSYATFIAVVPDADQMYEEFAAGLRSRFGRLPAVGIPRILRPRRRGGTVRGFSVVDPGGNWLRISTKGETEDGGPKTTGLARVIDNSARLGDSHGDEAAALKLLENGMAKFTDEPPFVQVRALLYRAELAVRLGDRTLATASLAEALSLDLNADEQAALAGEIAHANELVSGLD
jgi:catechol 2,3-dioxygenase-like lactoylglutathione lyase family enzyme